MSTSIAPFAALRAASPLSPDCACGRCQSCCQRPGWFLPDEIAPLADHLGLSVPELFAHHLVLDYWENGSNEQGDAKALGVLSPGKPSQHGTLASYGFPRDGHNCIFFQSGRCSIHAFKPHECAAAHHSSRPPHGHHQAVAQAWQGPEGQAMVRSIGFDPDHLDPFADLPSTL